MHKSIRALALILAGFLVTAVSAQDAKVTHKLDAGLRAGITDALGVNYSNEDYEAASQYTLTPSLGWTSTIPLEGKDSLSLGINMSDTVVFLAAHVVGKTAYAEPGVASTYANNAATGLDGETAQSFYVRPSATWKTGDITATIALPFWYNTATTGSMVNAASYMGGSRGLKYVALWQASPANNASAVNQSIAYNSETSMILGTTLKAAWKIALDKELVITPSVETEIALVPLWFASVIPSLNVVSGPVTTDIKAGFYYTPGDPQNLDALAGAPMWYPIVEPRVSLDFAKFGVKGLSAYVSGLVPLVFSENASGTATSLPGLSVVPGLRYVWDAWTFDFSSGFSYVDQGWWHDISSTPVYTSQMAWDPSLSVTYSLKF